MDFEFGVKLLDALFDFILAFLEVLNFFEEDVGEIIDVSGFAGLSDLEELIVGEGQRGELGSEFLGPHLQLLV